MTAVYADGGLVLMDNPTAGAVTLTAGTTTIATPTSGRKFRLRWLSLSSMSTGTECLVTVRFGGTQTLYLWGLPTPGAFSRRSVRQADNADDPLIVDLAPSGGPVYLNYELDEVS